MLKSKGWSCIPHHRTIHLYPEVPQEVDPEVVDVVDGFEEHQDFGNVGAHLIEPDQLVEENDDFVEESGYVDA